jgi:hypothetical protein
VAAARPPATAAGQTVWYFAAALALGTVGYFASEALFWSFVPDDTGLLGIALTVLVYTLAAGAGLSAALATGLGGWRGAFLGGAIMGFGVEGAIVATMYDGFPLQLVWTPIAWHALVSGVGVLGLGVWGAGASPARQVAMLAAIGVAAGIWSFYWPLERPVLPPWPMTAAYLVGTGALAALGLAALDRLLPGLRPPRAALLVLPACLLALFAVMTVIDPRPQRLAWVVLMGLTLLAMHRLGRPGTDLLARPPAPAWRHALFLVLPAITAAIAATVPATGGLGVNIPAAFALGLSGLALWLYLVASAVRLPRAQHMA